jgi:hypothetical protein
MSKLLRTTQFHSSGSNSVLGFSRPRDDAGNSGWERYLTIGGRPAYSLGVVCDTCAFVFERLDGANRRISAATISDRLRHGLSDIDSDVLTALDGVVPEGDYVASLLQLEPRAVVLGTAADYFCAEQIELWGVDSFWGVPHYPKVPYYRSMTTMLGGDTGVFEFVVPMYPPNWLDEEAVAGYETRIREEQTPTALAVSVLDVRQPAILVRPTLLTKHWCLTHYLIDGHHKTLAASLAGAPITLLSALAVNESITTKDDIEQVLALLRNGA